MNADDVRPQVLHLAEVFLDLCPLLDPVVFDQPTRLVVIVVEAPGGKLAAGLVESEGMLVGGGADELHFRGNREVRNNAGHEQVETRHPSQHALLSRLQADSPSATRFNGWFAALKLSLSRLQPDFSSCLQTM